MEALASCDPLPDVLALFETLQKGPDASQVIQEHGARLKNLFKRARGAAQAIEQGDVGVAEQAQIIQLLQERIRRKEVLVQRLSEAVQTSQAQDAAKPNTTVPQIEVQDVTMTDV